MAEEFDPNTADLGELREKILAAQASGELKEEQPRNADGTFAAKTTTTEDPVVDPTVDPAPETKPLLYEERKIDLHDGAGIQTFRGLGTSREEALTELTNKLVEAQENATRKIRQQQEQISKVTKPATQRSADEEFLLAQQLLSEPTKAIQQAFQDMVGVPISEFKSTLDAAKAFSTEQKAETARTQFIEANPDYFPDRANGTRIEKLLNTYGLPYTADNLTKVYKELQQDGLMKVKPTTAPVVDPAPTVVKRTSSGLTARGAANPTLTKVPTTLDEIRESTKDLSLAELRSLALSAERQAKSQ